MILSTNSSPLDALVAVELTSAPDSRTRVADTVIDDVAAESDANPSLRIPPFAVTLDVTTTEADPV